ncbi:MAG: hypothetical protein LBV79_06795 [Candidatus Adiutrix sp.]|jgi:hypothetical protein|nr:hypothetical protein [Candidatus Adiutrix sp.]
MILDKENLFSHGQAVTAAAPSKNIVDLGAGDAGPSERLSLFVNAGTAFTGGGTLTVELMTAAEMLPDGTAMKDPAAVASYAVTNAQLLAGGKLAAARLPHGMRRYAALNYKVDGSLAAGTITAGLVLDVQAA